MEHTKPWAIVLVICCTLFTSTGSLLLKKGADRLVFSVDGILHAYLVLAGLAFYFIGFMMLTLSFRHGELSVLFPLISLSFVWVAFLSSIFLGELVSFIEMLGIAAIVGGVVLIGLSSRNVKLSLRG